MSETLTKCERCGTEIALVKWPAATDGEMTESHWMEPLGWTKEGGARVWMSHTPDLCSQARAIWERNQRHLSDRSSDPSVMRVFKFEHPQGSAG